MCRQCIDRCRGVRYLCPVSSHFPSTNEASVSSHCCLSSPRVTFTNHFLLDEEQTGPQLPLRSSRSRPLCRLTDLNRLWRIQVVFISSLSPVKAWNNTWIQVVGESKRAAGMYGVGKLLTFNLLTTFGQLLPRESCYVFKIMFRQIQFDFSANFSWTHTYLFTKITTK